MKRFFTVGGMAIGLAIAVVACREYLPTNRYLRLRPPPKTATTEDARGKFNHASHETVLSKQGDTCLDCHRFDLTIDSANDAMARELSWQAMHPRGDACHVCHTNAETRLAAAPSSCTTCHDNLLPLVPDNHHVAWMKAHASVSRVESDSCASCHTQTFCIDCHQRRDTIQMRMHDRNFRYYHSIQARANPMQCSSCHRVDYCIRCHQEGKVEPIPQ